MLVYARCHLILSLRYALSSSSSCFGEKAAGKKANPFLNAVGIAAGVDEAA